MFDLKLTIETDARVGTPDMGRRVLGVLTRDSKWTPERFGSYEPLRGHFDPDFPEPFLDGWTGVSTGGQRRIGFHFARKKIYKYDATVFWYPHGSELNSIYFSFPGKRSDEAHANRCLEFGIQLFEAMSGQYGNLCLREEYWSKNVTGAWAGPSGGSEGGKAHGTDRRSHLPGIYWANLFGPAYISFFGEARLQSSPAFKSLHSSTCWALLTAQTPYAWNLPETQNREKLLRSHLGADAFFDLEQPEQATRAPIFARLQS